MFRAQEPLHFHHPKHAKLLSRKDQLSLHTACKMPPDIVFDGCMTCSHVSLPGEYRPYFQSLAPCVNLDTKVFSSDKLAREHLHLLNPTVALKVLPNAALCALCQSFNIQGINLHFMDSVQRFLLEGYDAVAEGRSHNLLMVCTYAPDDPFILYQNPPRIHAEICIALHLSPDSSSYPIRREWIQNLKPKNQGSVIELGPCQGIVSLLQNIGS